MTVQVGQVWQSNDKRDDNVTLLVTFVSAFQGFAEGTRAPSLRKVRVRIVDGKIRGYTLLHDVPAFFTKDKEES